MQLLSSGNKDLNEIALDPLVGVRSASGNVIERFGSALLFPLGVLASLVRVLGNGRKIRRWRPSILRQRKRAEDSFDRIERLMVPLRRLLGMGCPSFPISFSNSVPPYHVRLGALRL